MFGRHTTNKRIAELEDCIAQWHFEIDARYGAADAARGAGDYGHVDLLMNEVKEFKSQIINATREIRLRRAGGTPIDYGR